MDKIINDAKNLIDCLCDDCKIYTCETGEYCKLTKQLKDSIKEYERNNAL